MSYILDALNKAEKDRQRQAPSPIPVMPNDKTSSPHQKSTSKRNLFMVTIALLPLILWIVLSHEEEIPSKQGPLSQQAQVITPASEPTTQAKEIVPQLVQNTPVKAEIIIPNIMALDSELRNQLPPIAISAHVYSEKAKKRMVIINNQVKHEQQYIGENLQLTHITPQGIQLQYKNTAFTMRVRDQWPPS